MRHANHPRPEPEEQISRAARGRCLHPALCPQERQKEEQKPDAEQERQRQQRERRRRRRRGRGGGGGALGGAPPFTGAGLLICVAVAIVSFLLVARGVGEASDGFKIDKATSIQFPVEQKFDCCSTLALAGVGVRKKSGVIPIYSVGMYSSASGLSGGSAASLLARSAPKVAQLTFALITGVPAESAAAALRDGVAKVGGVDKAVLSEFKALLMSGLGSAKMKKKETMTLEWGGDGKSSVAVTVRGKYVGKIKNPSLANALLRLYLDEKYTVSKALVKNIGSGK